MEKKLRIQLFDDEGRLIDDRTVSQDPEMYAGPKENHQGLFRIEFTLNDKEDVEKAKDYLDKLVGNLPIAEKRGRKKVAKIPDDPQYREKLLEKVLESSKDQDELIANLREKDFVFMMTEFLETFDFPILDLKERHKKTFQWMIRRIRKAKNPKSDKYDPMLVFGIQLVPEHNERIVVYLNGKFKGYRVPVPSKPKEVFKKTKMLKFPPYMIEEEREKFRFELRALEESSERKPSKFFKRWVEFVENVPILSQFESKDDTINSSSKNNN